MKADGATTRFDSALVVTLSGTSKTRLEEIMRREGRKPLSQLSLRSMKTGPTTNRRCEVIINATIGNAAEVSECAAVSVEKR